MKQYQPTEKEIDALFIIAPFLHDAISINELYFYNDETDDEERKIIYEASKNIYKSCLKIHECNKSLPFA